MESLAWLVGAGVVGGSVLALIITRLKLQWRGPAGADAFVRQPLSTDVINMASIKVAGIGGLGMVVVSAVVAFTIPAVGVPVGAGLVSGSLLALVLIARRRRFGAMPSSGKGPGANTVLAIDAATTADDPTRPADDRHSDRHALIGSV